MVPTDYLISISMHQQTNVLCSCMFMYVFFVHVYIHACVNHNIHAKPSSTIFLSHLTCTAVSFGIRFVLYDSVVHFPITSRKWSNEALQYLLHIIM